MWICNRCNWFATEDALKWQEKIGIQSKPWICPGCKRPLEKEKK